ncbi:phage tail tube protein [Anaerotignum sp. MB30-C6]|uniref:phage tail tube protein n=1 Tax=Anaerotignum sp. MB30-C6 TaxID=3070814 RepID=UPI0027DD5B03|nr:phage tail tube protein [Anaerotignum sp. MB30-C6]WMI80902.1 phage tail tube protein [Anaerotignum sp. MB30-C6]
MKKNRILTGTTGNVWLDGQLLAQIKSIEAKISGNYEEADFVGDFATHHVYTGWTGEGTLVLHKIDSTALRLLADKFKTGVEPDLKIVTQLEDKNTKKSERVALSEIVFTEMMLAKFESKALIEEELPYKFSDYEVLEMIA